MKFIRRSVEIREEYLELMEEEIEQRKAKEIVFSQKMLIDEMFRDRYGKQVNK